MVRTQIYLTEEEQVKIMANAEDCVLAIDAVALREEIQRLDKLVDQARSLEKREIESKLKADPVPAFHEALENVKPAVEVRSRRVGGATYQVPVEVRPERRQALAIRWIIQAARDRSGHSMKEKLSAELLDASNNRGNAVKKREDTHRMAEANRAFSHYRW